MVTGRIDAAMRKLIAFIDDREDLALVFDRKWTKEELADLKDKPTYGVPLPPSYCYLVENYGPFKITRGEGAWEYVPMVQPNMMFGVSPDSEDACGADDPELEESIAASIENALFFQYQSDDAVQDFYCFSKDTAREDGELLVIEYRHDEVFENEPSETPATRQHSYGFEDHLVALVDRIIETFSRYP